MLVQALSILMGIASASVAEATIERGTISWYAEETCHLNPHPGCPTASGRSLWTLLEQQHPYCATWAHPFGTWLTVHGPRGERRCQVLDRGPAKRLRRIVDVSPQVFEQVCGARRMGICQGRIVEAR